MKIKEAVQRVMDIFVDISSVIVGILICYLCILVGFFLFIVVSFSLCYPVYLLGETFGFLK